MKRTVSILLAVLTLLTGLSAAASAEMIPAENPVTSNGPGSTTVVTSQILRGNEASATVYSFTVSWTQTRAVYCRHLTYTWDPAGLRYVPDASAPWTCMRNSGNVTLTVENRSNAPVLLSVKDIAVADGARGLVDMSRTGTDTGSVLIGSAAAGYGEQGTAQEGSVSATLWTVHENGDTVAAGAFVPGDMTLGTVTFGIDAVTDGE